MFTNINPLILLLIIFGIIYFLRNYSIESQKPYHDNIEKLTIDNKNYRQVLYTTSSNSNHFQLVLMSLLPGQEIGMEKHPHTTQFIRVEKGHGVAIVDGQKYQMQDGDVVVFPPNANHNLINISPTERLQLYSIYTPAEHPPKTLQPNKPKNDHH